MADTPPKTHNSDPNHQLNTIADRVCRLLDESDAIREDVKDILAEAKGAGFNPANLKAAIAVKRMTSDKREAWFEKQADVDNLVTKLGVLP